MHLPDTKARAEPGREVLAGRTAATARASEARMVCTRCPMRRFSAERRLHRKAQSVGEVGVCCH